MGVVVTVAALTNVSLGSGPASADEEQPSGNLSVVISDGDDAAPAPSASSAPPSAGSGAVGGTRSNGGSGSRGGAGSSGGAPDDAAGAIDAAAPPEESIGGVLYVSGLRSSSAPSLNPLKGTVSLWFTVRNVSKTVVDSSAKFWLTGPLGNRLGPASTVAVDGLDPGETRVVSADVGETGQWALVTAHVTFTPPTSVEGTDLAPTTHDAFLLVLPWLLVLLLAAAATAALVISRVGHRSAGALVISGTVGASA